MSELVRKLAEGSHPVEITLRPEKTMQALKECIERKYVHVKFTGTRGGTELGVRLDPAASDVGSAEASNVEGSIKVVGDLTLDYVKVRCIAEVNLKTFAGTGHLEIVDDKAASAVN